MAGTTTTTHDVSVASESGEPLRVTIHRPSAQSARLRVLFAHGLKGYKDYGFIPALSELLARRAGVEVYRFNFSHSGIGDDPATFQRPDLFERDTWRLQARDILTLMDHFSSRDDAGEMRTVLMGHSRGGASSLLAASECAAQGRTPPAGVIAISAPASLNRLNADARATLLREGRLDMPSARTGQMLAVGAAWLRDQIDDPSWHDLPARCAAIPCPALLVHGEADATVPVDDAEALGAACRDATVVRVPGADHVWNTPNPAPVGEVDHPNAALDALARACERFLATIMSRR